MLRDFFNLSTDDFHCVVLLQDGVLSLRDGMLICCYLGTDEFFCVVLLQDGVLSLRDGKLMLLITSGWYIFSVFLKTSVRGLVRGQFFVDTRCTRDVGCLGLGRLYG